MAWHSSDLPWVEFERRLSGRAPIVVDPVTIEYGDGTDTPAHTRKRPRYQAPALVPARSSVDYAELHCHTSFSFLDGASPPEELVEEARRLGLTGLAVTDHDGFYAVVQFAAAAREHDLPTLVGAELSLDLPSPRTGSPDPAGHHLLVLARGPAGYAALSRAIAAAQLAGGEKGRPAYQMEEIATALRDRALVLTGCRRGSVPTALLTGGEPAAARELDRLVALFGRDNVAVELTRVGHPDDDERLDALAGLARRAGLPVVATGNVHYARPGGHRLAGVLAAVRARRSLDEMAGWLPPAGAAHLRGGDEMAARFRAFPGAVAQAARFGRELAIDLALIAPDLPDFPVPAGHTEMSWLRHLTRAGAMRRYGDPAGHPDAYRQLDHELEVIDRLGFPGYFLIVHEIVEFCRANGIYCQGRGSAANSAVCYALGITNVDAVRWKLLFERFLTAERDGYPDIDLDIESDRREEAIQHVYERYGRRHAAQVANVIAYRARSAVRDVARAFGFSPGQQDAWSRQIERWGAVADGEGIPEQVVAYANELQTFPRHLGVHSGGMVICDRPVIDVCPVEWARATGRTVVQWDKDDCADIGLVKIDLLGLGMLSALHYAFDMIDSGREPGGGSADLPTAAGQGQLNADSSTPAGGHPTYDLAHMPLDDPEVYAMLCRADSVGVFQVESRAQMATLPRLKPVKFYDLVVEVALIRPGPIQGGSVHPYIRRRQGTEKPEVPHPLMRRALDKTLGIPLFQEQLMQLAIDVAGFDAGEADLLRRAMSGKRSMARMTALRERLYQGMAGNGITGALADEIYLKLSSFANFGFPESHAMSFAYLVFASAWLKRYHPAAFCAALLNAQPMGFYSPQTLVDDARRHGVTVLRPDINASAADTVLDRSRATRDLAGGADEPPEHWGRDGPAVRLGLRLVRSLGGEVARRIETERVGGGPYQDMVDLARRAGLSAAHLEALATADAFACFGLSRRAALWAAGAAARDRPDRLPGTTTGVAAPPLPGMDLTDRLVADVWATGLSPESHPAAVVRDRLAAAGALPIARLAGVEDRRRVLVGGIVTHRQRPATAGGITFLNLEDETGLLNVVCSAGLWQRYRVVARSSAALLVRGVLERADGVTNLVADRLAPVRVPVRSTSRDFR